MRRPAPEVTRAEGVRIMYLSIGDARRFRVTEYTLEGSHVKRCILSDTLSGRMLVCIGEAYFDGHDYISGTAEYTTFGEFSADFVDAATVSADALVGGDYAPTCIHLYPARTLGEYLLFVRHVDPEIFFDTYAIAEACFDAFGPSATDWLELRAFDDIA